MTLCSQRHWTKTMQLL